MGTQISVQLSITLKAKTPGTVMQKIYRLFDQHFIPFDKFSKADDDTYYIFSKHDAYVGYGTVSEMESFTFPKNLAKYMTEAVMTIFYLESTPSSDFYLLPDDED